MTRLPLALIHLFQLVMPAIDYIKIQHDFSTPDKGFVVGAPVDHERRCYGMKAKWGVVKPP
jgi:hypothetical protein